MKQETIKIQVLNDTKLCVLPVLPDMKTIVPVESISGLTVSWGIRGHETEKQTLTPPTENGYIVLPISASMPLGVYSVHMQGTINGEQWSDNRYEMFELVKYGEGIRYDRYYTTTVIIGLPDSYVQELREEWERKIAEAEAAKQEAIEKGEEYEQRIEKMDNIATKEDLLPLLSLEMFKAWVENVWTAFTIAIQQKAADIYQAIGEQTTWMVTNLIRREEIDGYIPKDYARQGEVAKTLDDIKVEIPEDLARKGDIPTDYTRQADLTRATDTISGKIGPLDATKVVAIETEFFDGFRFVPTGERERISGRFYYKWICPDDETLIIYTQQVSPIVGNNCYIKDESTTTMTQIGTVDAIYHESLVSKMDEVAAKLDTIIANTSLTAAQADEDWQNVQPITE